MHTKKDSIISNIIWKYANYRRDAQVPKDVTLELLSFVYEHKVEFKMEGISSALAQYKYVSGILSASEEDILLNNYPDVVETFCHSNENGMTSYSEALQPYEVTQFAVGLLKLKDGAKVYNPFGGYASYAIAAPQYHFSGDELDKTTWAILKLRLLVKGIDADYSLCDSFKRISSLDSDYFDGVIATPPFGMREHNELETASVLLEKIKREGRVVLVTSLSSLYRGSGRDEQIRMRLVNSGLIESIIELPDSLFFDTSIPCAVIVLSNGHNEGIQMIDASTAYKEQEGRRGKKLFDEALLKQQMPEVSRLVSKDEVAVNSYRLLPKQYLLKLDNQIESRKLSDLCDIQSPVRINEETRVELGGFMSLKGLSSTFPTSSLRKEPSKSKNAFGRGYIVKKSSIVVLRSLPTATALSIGYTDDKTCLPFICGADSYFVLHVTSPAIIPQYLMLQLQSEYVWKQVKSFAMGTSIQRISSEDFRNLRIPFVSLSEQEKCVRLAIEESLSDIEQKRAKEAELYQKGVHTRKHALEQTVSALSSRWNKLVNYLYGANSDAAESETIKAVLGYIIPGVNKLSVSEQIEAIGNLIQLAEQQVDNIAEVKVNVKAINTFNPTQLIVDYLRRFQSNLYLPVVEFTDMENANDTIDFPISILEQIFNNIVSNAVEYGFHNTETPGNKIRFRCFKEASCVIIEIANNGDPLKEGVDADTIFTANFSTLLNTRGHSGTGATEVRSLMEQFGGSVEAYSTPEEEYTFTYRLVFNEINK